MVRLVCFISLLLGWLVSVVILIVWLLVVLNSGSWVVRGMILCRFIWVSILGELVDV